MALRYLSLCSGIEAATVAWEPLGWLPAAFAEIEKFPSAVLAHHYPSVPNLGDITKISGKDFRGKIDLIVGGPPCQSYSVAGSRKGLDDPRGQLTLVFLGIVGEARPRWSLSKMCPAFWEPTKEERLEPSSGRWRNSGMGSPGAYWTLNTLECRSGAAGSTLSDILETGDLPPRYFLSVTACRGILRRAEKRGKKLPAPLQAALEAAAGARM